MGRLGRLAPGLPARSRRYQEEDGGGKNAGGAGQSEEWPLHKSGIGRPIWRFIARRAGDGAWGALPSGGVGGAAFAGGVGAEDAVEDFVDVAEVALQVEGVF